MPPGPGTSRSMPVLASRSSGWRWKGRSSTPGRRWVTGNLFGDLPLRPVSPGAKGPDAWSPHKPRVDAERLLRAFMRRAYRRPVTPQDVEPVAQAGVRSTRRQAELRGSDARRLQGHPVLARFPLFPGETRRAGRFRPGRPAVVLSLEHPARRRAVEAGGARRIEPAGPAAGAGGAAAEPSQGAGLQSRTSWPSGSTCG